MSLLWENFLAVLELISLVCSSALPRGTLSKCISDTPIMGSGNVLLYPLDTVPTDGFIDAWMDLLIDGRIYFRINGFIDIWLDFLMDGLNYLWMDGFIDRRLDYTD